MRRGLRTAQHYQKLLSEDFRPEPKPTPKRKWRKKPKQRPYSATFPKHEHELIGETTWVSPVYRFCITRWAPPEIS